MPDDPCPGRILGKSFQKREEHCPDMAYNIVNINTLQIGIGLDTIEVYQRQKKINLEIKDILPYNNLTAINS
jgi:hypothetical protein